MNILVTGGSGYIGSIVARELAEAGHQIRILDEAQAPQVRILLPPPPRRSRGRYELRGIRGGDPPEPARDRLRKLPEFVPVLKSLLG